MPTLRRSVRRSAPAIAAALTLQLAAEARADDWTNAGGNPERNGQSTEAGPQSAEVLWSGGETSIIAYQPVTSGPRVCMVRQTDFIPGNVPNDSAVVCQDLNTGALLWKKSLPYQMGDWTAWVAGVSAGKVYASRSGNGNSVLAKIHALSETSGDILWSSDDFVGAGPYDGVVFAPNGDLVIGEQTDILRVSAADGSTVWKADRVCSVTSSCGVALHGDAVYAADAVVGGHAIKRFDLQSGAFQYQGPTMPGFTLQNTPMVGPDGTVYLSRTQNNAATDKFYAFTDNGAALVQKWAVPAGWSTTSEFAVGPDGGVYMLAPGGVLARLDPGTGATLAQSMPVQGGAPRIAIDQNGVVFLSNGGFDDGQLYAFGCDLSLLWSVPVANINIGAPALGENGTLVVAGIGTDVTAYRSMSATGPTSCATGGTGGSGGGGATGGGGTGGDTGGTTGTGAAGGSTTSTGGTGGTAGSGTVGNSGGDGASDTGGDPDTDGGCGCRTAPETPRYGLSAVLALALALLRIRRERCARVRERARIADTANRVLDTIHPMRRASILSLAAPLAVVALAACGGNSPSGSTGGGGAGGTTSTAGTGGDSTTSTGGVSTTGGTGGTTTTTGGVTTGGSGGTSTGGTSTGGDGGTSTGGTSTAGSGGTNSTGGAGGSGGGSGGGDAFTALLASGDWLMGWSGGLDHFSWVRFNFLNGFQGSFDVLDSQCVSCTGFFFCEGKGLFTADPPNESVTMQLPLACNETKVFAFGVCSPPMGFPQSANLACTMHDEGGQSYMAYRYPAGFCAPDFSSCPDPFQ